MKIAFWNPNPNCEYSPASVDAVAMAGAESAQIRLAQAMARLGHGVCLHVGRSPSQTIDGIACRPSPDDLARLRGFDAVVVSDHRRVSLLAVRNAIGPAPVLVAWEHDCFRPTPAYVARVAEIGPANAWMAAVSDWHARWIARTYPYLGRRLFVLRNGIAPAFEAIAADADRVLAAKPGPPVLAYTSSPRGGLDRVLDAFRLLRGIRPDARIVVHSGFDHYPPDDPLRRDPGWLAIAAECASEPGMVWSGVVPQARLVDTLRNAAILFYPNTIKETSCIAAMEAMASGLAILTHPNGALPETLAGFGFLEPAPAGPSDVADGNRRFAAAAAARLARVAADDPDLRRHLRSQMAHARDHLGWQRRAEEAAAAIAALAP